MNRYGMIFRNGSGGDQHPMHLHRHTFEVTRIGTKEFSGLREDVVNGMPFDSVAVDFVADNPAIRCCIAIRPCTWILGSCSS
jgi:FtsP/CotA-like multicopper oxidase with cupredoxin domain